MDSNCEISLSLKKSWLSLLIGGMEMVTYLEWISEAEDSFSVSSAK